MDAPPRPPTRRPRHLVVSAGTLLAVVLPGLRCRPEAAPPPAPGSAQESWSELLRDWAHRARERFDAPTRAPAEVRLDDYLVVDVREPRESAVSTLPGARLLNDAGAREAFLGERRAAASERPVLVYCTVGWRSGEYARALTDAGVEAFNLEGGLCGWASGEGEIVDPEGAPTRRIHAYSADFAACVPATHEAVTD